MHCSRAKQRLLQFTAVALALAVILALMGRRIWCACAEATLWINESASSHTSQHFLDPYSFSHLQHGLLFFAFLHLLRKPSFLTALLIEAGWEILENSPFIIERYRTATASLNYYGDTILNSLGDLSACALGFLIASKLPFRVSLAIFVIIEVTMVATIRDSLLLNIIMLIYPLNSIKEWQTA